MARDTAMKPKRLLPLVGRSDQLAAALDAISTAHDGRGRVVLIHGEAGIGKTRLCHELRSRLDRRTTRLITGRAGPGDAGMSYSVLADSLRAARRSGDAFWAAAGGRAETLAAVVPELARRGSVASTLVDRPVVYEALLDLVEEAAVDRRTVWFMEDLHWADPATWAFVEYASRRVGDMSLVLVATARDEGLAVDTHGRLLALRRDSEVLDLALERLGDADARAMAGAIAPELPAPAIERVARRSAGNPLLVEELLALGGDLAAGIPDIVRAAVRERTARLDADDRVVLETAAAIGPRFDVDLLLRTAAIDPARAREQLAGGGLVVAADDSGGDVLAFWHPLVWEAVYNDIPLPRRRQLHATIATTLEAQDLQLQPENLARHHELADDPDAALETLLVARKAVGGNVGRAASLARAALDLARRHPPLYARVDELARLAVNDLFLAGRWTELEPLVNELWRTRHTMPAEARAWLANAAVMDFLFLGEVARARATADDEVAYVETAGDSSGAGLLFAQAAFLAYFSGDFTMARDRSERAVVIARSSGDAEASARAQLVSILARRRLDHSRGRSVSDLRDNAAFARSAGLGVREANSLFVVAYMTLHEEDFAAAEEVGAAAGTWYAPLAQVLHGLLHVLEGRPDEAEGLLARAGAEVRHGIPTLGLAVDIAEAHLFLHRGEVEHARALLDRTPAAPEAKLIPMLQSGLAGARGWLAWEEQRLGDAADAFAESLTSCLAGGGYDIIDTGPLMLPLQADALVRLTRAAEAQHAIERCAAADTEPDRFTVAAVAAARFRLAPSEDAAAAAERAAADGPWPWLQALLGCWRGEMLDDGDAVTLARDRFDAIGALRGVAQADALLDRLGRRTGNPAGASPPELSPRELEVAELVTEGLTNSAIAARLFVSRATVSSHVTHILTKLGFTSRAQIAAWIAAGRAPSR
jgi:DNA-binding CsgD family transcriptional regulator